MYTEGHAKNEFDLFKLQMKTRKGEYILFVILCGNALLAWLNMAYEITLAILSMSDWESILTELKRAIHSY